MTDPVKQSGREVPDAKHTANTPQPSAASPDLTQPKAPAIYKCSVTGKTYDVSKIETDYGTLTYAEPIEEPTIKVDLLRIDRIQVELTTDGLLEMTGKGWTVQSIDGKDLIGFCHSCNTPVLEDDPDGRCPTSGLLFCDDCMIEDPE